jgi:hypothetical protein
MSDSIQQHEGERGNTVDQVADLLMADDAPEEEASTEEAVHRPNDDDLVDDSEESEVTTAQESDDGVEYDDETDDSNELETDDDDGLAALAAELGLDADKLALSEDGDVLVKLKVNGKDETVDLKEAIAGTQFHKANDEKARTLAEERKQFESDRDTAVQELGNRLQHVQNLGQMLEQKLMSEFNAIDFDRLRVSDPAEWAAKQQEFQMRQAELQQMGQQVGQQMAQHQGQLTEQEQAQRQELLAQERAALTTAIPDWADEEKMTSGLGEIIEYARAQGFPNEELADVIHSRHVITLRKAMLYDQGKTVAEKKVKKAPRMQRASNGRFAAQKKGGKVQKLVERAQAAKGANKREAQADAVAALLMGE